jgi:hypothetical protein
VCRRRKTTTTPPTDDELRESLEDASVAFAEQRKRQSAQIEKEKLSRIVDVLERWYRERSDEGLYNIDYEHKCTRVECRGQIEMIGPSELHLYGCRKSGLYHQCEMGPTCAMRPLDAGYRRARRNFYFYHGEDAGMYCMFSTVYSTRSMDQHNTDDVVGSGMAYDDSFEMDDNMLDPENQENDPTSPQKANNAIASGSKRSLENVGGGDNADDGFSAKRPTPAAYHSADAKPEEKARLQIEYRLDLQARKESAVHNQKTGICHRIRALIMRLCYSDKWTKKARTKILETRRENFQSRVMTHIRKQQASKQRVTLDSIVTLHEEMRRGALPLAETPDPSDGEPDRISAIIYRVWVLIVRSNVIPDNARSIGLIQVVVGVLYLMCNGYTMAEQTAGLGESHGSAMFVRRQAPGSSLAIAPSATPQLLLGPETTGSESGVLVAGTPIGGLSMSMEIANDAAVETRRIMLGSRLSEFSEGAREHTILPAVEVLRKHLPPREYLHLYASKDGGLKSSMVTRGQSVFFNAMAKLDMSPRECSEYVLNSNR